MRLSTSDLPGFTASYGIVAADQCANLEDAVRLADDALYLAKSEGRNCSIVADTSAPLGTTAISTIRLTEKLRSTTVGVLASLARDDDPLDR